MNLAIRGIDGNIGPHYADSFTQDIHKDLKANYILANPPFNVKEWKGELLREDVRWKHGALPAGNANFAWMQHIIHHLSPNGIAGFVLANGSMSSNTSGEGEIRKKIIDADLVDCMIALPGQLFYTTPIPACLWFITKNKKNGVSAYGHTHLRDRTGQTLFIDARKMGHLVDHTHRELSDEEIHRIVKTYHAWRFAIPSTGEGQGEGEIGKYKDVPGFCKSTTIEEIRAHGYVLTPGRYVGSEDIADDDEPFAYKMKSFVAKLEEQFNENEKLKALIRKNLMGLGYNK